MKRKTSHAWLLCLASAACLAGCAATPRPADSLHLVAQICLRGANDSFNNIAFGIWDIDGEHSATEAEFGTGGRTASNQPYFVHVGKGPGQTRVLGAMVVDEKDAQDPLITYWFNVPKEQDWRGFTDWQLPFTQETRAEQRADSVMAALMLGRAAQVRPLSGPVPRMRFALQQQAAGSTPVAVVPGC